ncbi:MAG TPA: putative zinc-binding metallopeptidase [Verrucomicrobiae bacterium]|nr:putative zinc-binding metallopeptidase [Verrucomicrobiae bacterium]
MASEFGFQISAFRPGFTKPHREIIPACDEIAPRVRLARMESADWLSLSDDELLERKISSLGLRIENTELQPLIRQLYSELSQKNLLFHPPCHIGDEWFVPVGIPAIFIPFFLTHERLRKLERKMMLEVEGETPDWFMKLIRHEAAHAYFYAFQLQKKTKWRRVFGPTSTEETPEFYRPRPYSHSYVVHLDDWYAQSHPDEDFAETFAVWLTPGLDWRERYRGWKALQKLEYVDELMRSLAGKPPPHQPSYAVADYSCLDVKLRTYYARKRKLYEETYPDFYDNDLRQLFAAGADSVGRVKASVYLRHHRKQLMEAVCQWTNEKKFRVDKLLHRLIDRCDELNLFIKAYDPKQNLQVSAYITTLVMNHLFTGKFKRTK